MKQNLQILAAVFFGGVLTASADLTIPSDGSDGALNITQDTVIDLSQAVTGVWDQNNAANAGKGVYDPDKWAIVFKYTSVNIAGHTSGIPAVIDGRKLKFKNHPSHAPVVWLVQGSVNIEGIVDVAGQEAATPDPTLGILPRESGPGGFRGAAFGPSGRGSGYGPGGSGPGGFTTGHGVYLTAYGNPQIIPLIGGSGGGSYQYSSTISAGAGAGGAILIAAAQTITVSGRIDARGGEGFDSSSSGSGGAIRLIAQQVIGGGALQAVSPGEPGRLRIETATPLPTAPAPVLQTFPETIGVPPSNPPIIWPAANAPKARVVSVDAQPAPADPSSPLVAAADVAIQNNNPVNILIETRDFPIEGVVQLAVIPKFAGRSMLPATRIGGDINLATWRVTTTLPKGFVTLQARATQP